MSKLDHTKVAEWTFSNNNGTTKTITNLTADKPLVIIHRPVGTSGYCYVCVTAGTLDAKTGTNAYIMGTMGDHGAASNHSMVVVPNATSVSIYFSSAQDDKFYVYQ